MITAWILMYQLTTGAVAVYSVYTNEAECRAVASTVKHTVATGIVDCVAVRID